MTKQKGMMGKRLQKKHLTLSKAIKSAIRRNIWGILITTTFFFYGLTTLSHYGLNIDEPIHFIRGQAYLHFFLTGKKEYSESDLKGERVSAWKIQQYNGAYFFNNDSGHPPLNGILAALTNKIFYEKLGILGDLEAYHFFELLVSTSLVFLVYNIAVTVYGNFAAVMAAVSLSLSPLFLGESKFNIKDPIETAFFAFTLHFFYFGIEKLKSRDFLFSSLFFTLALGTKFNIVFLPIIFLPYLLIRHFSSLLHFQLCFLKKIPKSVYLALFLYPLIVLGIHFLTRPYLWGDPFTRFLETVQYYRGIGTGGNYQPDYLFNGWNLYPLIFIFFSTPLVIFFFCFLGFFKGLWQLKEKKDKFSLLLILWLIMPILRVMWPGSSIYSGVRQIMEYLPAMAVLSGLGAFSLREKLGKFLKNPVLGSAIVLLFFFPLGKKLWQLHPNENVFMNSLGGGLKGAVERKMPGAGETMGNVYLQGIWWLNKNVEKNARIGLPVGLLSNIPRQFLREDLKIGAFFSGMNREGEYMMEMVSVDFPPRRYNYQYLEQFLIPVYQVKVDEVPLLKIWKNDKEHTKPGFLEELETPILQVEGGRNEGYLKINLEEPSFLTRLEIEYEREDCLSEGGGDIKYSPDGIQEIYIQEELFASQGPYAKSLQTKNRFVYFFPAVKAYWIQITSDLNLCLLSWEKIRLSALKEITPD